MRTSILAHIGDDQLQQTVNVCSVTARLVNMRPIFVREDNFTHSLYIFVYEFSHVVLSQCRLLSIYSGACCCVHVSLSSSILSESMPAVYHYTVV